MRGMAAIILLVALPNILAAQDERLQRIRQAFSPEAVAQMEDILVEAEGMGLPTGPLLDKALEGAAKGVPDERVVGALRAYSLRLRESRALVGTGRETATVVAGADALRRGVPPEAMRTLADAHTGELAVPLVVLGDLIEAGISTDDAYAVLEDALATQQSVDEMLAIPGAVRRLMRDGQSASEAAGAVGRAIGSGKFKDMMGPPGRAATSPPKGPPVPPGSGPPEHAGPKKEKGKPPPD